ncbi:MAG: RNA polymerase sigma factor [Rhizobiaceae bacterium]
MNRDAALEDARAAAEAAARRSYGKLVALLSARSRDVAGAEDALSEAFAAALKQWPESGVPANPEGWLLAVARRRGIDQARRRQTTVDARAHLTLIAEEAEAVAGTEHDLPDERLRLMFACAHPAIEPGIRAPLILQTVLGFDAAAIASAFLVPPATMAQRLVRAKARIREAGIPFSIPERAQLAERLGAVLAAIYATFSEGWGDAHDGESRQRNLAREGIWLGRLVAALMPDEPEALSLLALMLFAEARRAARRSEAGDYVPLAEQDTNRWDHAMLSEAERLLAQAGRLAGLGRYQIEAAVQAVHAARRILGHTDWRAIVTLYDALATISASPVVAINRAVALAALDGPVAGLAALASVRDAPNIGDYQPYWAALAALSAEAGNTPDALEAYDRGVGLAADEAVRRFLLEKRARLTS